MAKNSFSIVAERTKNGAYRIFEEFTLRVDSKQLNKRVVESLAKGGMPSRAEVTDAAMGSRAECVMLNKGPYIRETLQFLSNVLGRMEEHQHKKSSRLRKLRVSDASRVRLRPSATPLKTND